MKLATWNINSVRLRLDALKQFAHSCGADIICLQETKVSDEHFPLQAIESMGYPYVFFRGEKSYNGVAILSKIPLAQPLRLDMAEESQTRHISAVLPDGTELHNLYIPAGGDEPCVKANPKFAYKLDCIDWLRTWFDTHRSKKDSLIAVGDFNIAPYEHDVWSHKQLLKVVSHTPVEVEKLMGWYQGLDWIDISRHFVPKDEKLYSWWSYRNRDWRKSNRGRRLDHIWMTPACSKPVSHQILQDMRDWKQPSDHVPILVEW